MRALPFPLLDSAGEAGDDKDGQDRDCHAADGRRSHRFHHIGATAGGPEDRHKAEDGGRLVSSTGTDGL